MTKLKITPKKLKIIIAIVIGIVLIVGIVFACIKINEVQNPTDAIKFKTEYEKLNNTTNDKGKTYRSLQISTSNPMKYASAGKIVEKMNSQETFLVYFGFAKCPWCRSVVGELMNVANDQKLNKIYYVDIENIRDTLSYDENDNLMTTKDGSDDYYTLIEKMSNVLEDYTIQNKNNEETLTGEKRIYAPNIIAVINGEAQNLTTGISTALTDPYAELTDEIKSDSYQKIKKVVQSVVNADPTCTTENPC